MGNAVPEQYTLLLGEFVVVLYIGPRTQTHSHPQTILKSLPLPVMD